VTVVTHRDTLHTQEDRDKALELASAATGSSRSHTFFVANYCPNNPGPDVNTELQIFNILHVALLNSERYVENAKQKRNEKIKEEIMKALNSGNKIKPHAIVPQGVYEVFSATSIRVPPHTLLQTNKQIYNKQTYNNIYK
jgi:hypothetical protein